MYLLIVIAIIEPITKENAETVAIINKFSKRFPKSNPLFGDVVVVREGEEDVVVKSVVIIEVSVSVDGILNNSGLGFR